MKTFFSSSIDRSIFLSLIYTVLNSDFVFIEPKYIPSTD